MSHTDTLPKFTDDENDTRTTGPSAGRRTRVEGKRRLDISLTQVLGGAAAAATAAALGARLGVAGTIVGAAVISLISAVAGSLYTASLRTTRAGVKAAVVKARGSEGTAVLVIQPTSVTDDGDQVADRGDQVADRGDKVADRGDKVADRGDKVTDRGGRRRLRPWHVIALAVGSFVLAIVGITGYELITGSALDGTPGTTIQQVNGRDGGATPSTDAPPADRSTAPTSGQPVTPSTAPSAPASSDASPSSTPSTTPTVPSTEPTATPSPAEPSGAADAPPVLPAA